MNHVANLFTFNLRVPINTYLFNPLLLICPSFSKSSDGVKKGKFDASSFDLNNGELATAPVQNLIFSVGNLQSCTAVSIPAQAQELSRADTPPPLASCPRARNHPDASHSHRRAPFGMASGGGTERDLLPAPVRRPGQPIPVRYRPRLLPLHRRGRHHLRPHLHRMPPHHQRRDRRGHRHLPLRTGQAQARVLSNIMPLCYNRTARAMGQPLDSQFRLSDEADRFPVIGCNSLAYPRFVNTGTD